MIVEAIFGRRRAVSGDAKGRGGRTDTLDPVARTMMIPLWARAAEMLKPHPLVNDPRALEICRSLDFDFEAFKHSYGTQIGCVLRGLLYDGWVSEFLARHPTGTIVELGAGLTTRYERIDNGQAHWIDVDMPDAMELRRRHVEPSARRSLVGLSVLDPKWPAAIRAEASGPYCFVSEGMMMYLEPGAVRALMTLIADEFPGAVMFFDSISPSVVRHQKMHDSMKHMMDAPFRWGIEDARRVEQWDPRFRIEASATLPDMAAMFGSRVALHHRVIGRLVAFVPWFAGAYRVSRLRF